MWNHGQYESECNCSDAGWKGVSGPPSDEEPEPEEGPDADEDAGPAVDLVSGVIPELDTPMSLEEQEYDADDEA